LSNTEWIEINRDALTGDLETRIQALLGEAFPEGSSTNGDYYAFHGVPDRILIAREARQVVGHLALYQRQVKMGDEVLEIGMVGGVAVAPDHRRRGHCRLLLLRAHDDLRLQADAERDALPRRRRGVEDLCLSRQHVCRAHQAALAEPNARIGWRGRVEPRRSGSETRQTHAAARFIVVA
jgi:N-acetylglutamate synthase-like GNAT family acetyltransferase